MRFGQTDAVLDQFFDRLGSQASNLQAIAHVCQGANITDTGRPKQEKAFCDQIDQDMATLRAGHLPEPAHRLAMAAALAALAEISSRECSVYPGELIDATVMGPPVEVGAVSPTPQALSAAAPAKEAGGVPQLQATSKSGPPVTAAPILNEAPRSLKQPEFRENRRVMQEDEVLDVFGTAFGALRASGPMVLATRGIYEELRSRRGESSTGTFRARRGYQRRTSSGIVRVGEGLPGGEEEHGQEVGEAENRRLAAKLEQSQLRHVKATGLLQRTRERLGARCALEGALASWRAVARARHARVEEGLRAKMARTRVLRMAFGPWHHRAQQAAREQCVERERAIADEARAKLLEQLGADRERLTAEAEGLSRQLAEEARQRTLLQENLKRVFMRGVCALNFEAMSLLADGGPEAPDWTRTASDADAPTAAHAVPAAPPAAARTAEPVAAPATPAAAAAAPAAAPAPGAPGPVPGAVAAQCAEPRGSAVDSGIAALAAAVVDATAAPVQGGGGAAPEQPRRAPLPLPFVSWRAPEAAAGGAPAAAPRAASVGTSSPNTGAGPPAAQQARGGAPPGGAPKGQRWQSATAPRASGLQGRQHPQLVSQAPGLELAMPDAESVVCAVCLDEVKPTERQSRAGPRTGCVHVFHWDCIWQWLNIKAVCPVCNAPLLDHGIFQVDPVTGQETHHEIFPEVPTDPYTRRQPQAAWQRSRGCSAAGHLRTERRWVA
ncbi:unnamed protein product [Prorocentrum cordatum]|uniref:Centrosomal protein POC5 n=1 Tax=Prorocentrum cordatum TaxID=2364126 RepID=A0ABN9S9K8_9DINO|nr:unnamed protein product [Polarella glacialis]